MATYYVSDETGDNVNTGLSGSGAKKTLAAAVAVAIGGSGNTVEIIDSNQYDEGEIVVATNAITVIATGSNTPTLDGDSGNKDEAFEVYVSGCIFQGLTMRNYDESLIKGANAAGKNFLLSGCLGYAFGGPQKFGGAAGSSEVHDCIFVADTNACINMLADAKLWCNNSLLASNGVTGEAVLNSSINYPNVTASFCTIIGSGYVESSDRYYNLVNQVGTVVNCIVSGSGDGINAASSTYNLVHVNGDPFVEFAASDYNGTARSANTGEVTGDPLFVSGSLPGKSADASDHSGNVSASAQNYNLQRGSPALDAGTPTQLSWPYGEVHVTVDISGNQRAKAHWSAYSTPPESNFGVDFTINLYNNTPAQYHRACCAIPDIGAYEFLWPKLYYYGDLANALEGLKSVAQPPFSLGAKGPASIRGRSEAYKVEKD